MPLPLASKRARLVTPAVFLLVGLLFWPLGGGIASVLLVLSATCLAVGFDALEARRCQPEAGHA